MKAAEVCLKLSLTSSGDSKGGWVGHEPPRFLAGSQLRTPSFVLTFTFKFVCLKYTSDNFQPAILQIKQ